LFSFIKILPFHIMLGESEGETLGRSETRMGQEPTHIRERHHFQPKTLRIRFACLLSYMLLNFLIPTQCETLTNIWISNNLPLKCESLLHHIDTVPLKRKHSQTLAWNHHQEDFRYRVKLYSPRPHTNGSDTNCWENTRGKHLGDL